MKRLSIAALLAALIMTGHAMSVFAEEQYIAIIYQDKDQAQANALEIQEGPPINEVSEALEEADENRPVYADIHFTEEEGDLLARILWAEANNQCFEGQKACVEVIFNRLRSPEWPNSIVGVLSQPGQIATWKSRNKVHPTEVQYDAISEVLRETSTVLPDTSYVYFDRKGVNGKNHIRIQDHVFGR